MKEKYLLLDSGDQLKLEQFGEYVIARPCSQALWRTSLSKAAWDSADASFSRDGGNSWKFKKKYPKVGFQKLKGCVSKFLLLILAISAFFQSTACSGTP